MTLKQRGRIYGSAITIPGVARIQDGDGTTLADVLPTETYIYDNGVAKGTQGNTIIEDTDKAWTVDALIGMVATIHLEGTATEESQTITDNNANTITVGSSWGNNPVDAVTHYRVTSTGNALLVKGAEISIDAEEINITNMKVADYKTATPTLIANQDTQLKTQQYGFQVVTELPIYQAPITYTWNADGTVATVVVVIGGKTYTLTYTWNADGTLNNIATVVS